MRLSFSFARLPRLLRLLGRFSPSLSFASVTANVCFCFILLLLPLPKPTSASADYGRQTLIARAQILRPYLRIHMYSGIDLEVRLIQPIFIAQDHDAKHKHRRRYGIAVRAAADRAVVDRFGLGRVRPHLHSMRRNWSEQEGRTNAGSGANNLSSTGIGSAHSHAGQNANSERQEQ